MDFVDEFIDEALAKEMPKLNNIMRFMVQETQKDLYNKIVVLLDTYYWSYPNTSSDGYPEYPRKYVRVDDFKKRHNIDANGRKHDKKGHLAKMSKTEMRRKDDISLRTAIVTGASSISFAVETESGYEAGLLFSKDYFERAMEHSGRGISEWDIAQNFLFSDQPGVGNWALRAPSPDTELNAYIDNYDSRMDRHYKIACDKYR